MISIGGFLTFNSHPAKIFMGDTGSLFIGAIISGFSLVANKPFILLPLGIVYIIETLSVIIQVSVYKRTKKRVFLMSPLHHHFELLGLNEHKIVALFSFISLIGFFVFIFTL